MVGPERISPQEFEAFSSSFLGDAGIPYYHTTSQDLTTGIVRSEAMFPMVSTESLRNLDENELLDYIRLRLAKGEMELYKDDPDAESKLAFTGGSLRRDISRLTTVEGKPIYSKPQRYAKLDEIEEFLVVAGRYLDNRESAVEVAGEAADIFYNMVRLVDLDPRQEDATAPNYLGILGRFAGELGWSKKEALLITATKFHIRFIEEKGKTPDIERKAIELLLRSASNEPRPVVTTPTREKVNHAFNYMDKVKRKVTSKRYRQIRAKKFANGIGLPTWDDLSG
jgi:hypothetical protein